MTKTKERYAASIVRMPDGSIRIRVARGEPTHPGDGELVEVLYGDDEQELKERAVKFAQERVT
ncbi:MAG TPA: hypothetical protein VL426_03675 [Candidatus Binatia bacterium]|jgi:hypothetical protein|nr:hypothetical protein [Candidatus Binatia bacterium]